jgi:hypothetical protein
MIDARDPADFQLVALPRPSLSRLSSLLIKLSYAAGQLVISFTIRVTDLPVYPFKSNRAGRHEMIYSRLKRLFLQRGSRHACIH